MKLLPVMPTIGGLTVAALALCGAANPASGQIWTEIGDAGDYPTNAQVTAGIGALLQIKGSCLKGDREMYLIAVTNAAVFRAAVTAPKGNDTLLGLFDTNGMGIVMNDDTPVPYDGLSTLDFSKNGIPLSNGAYILAVMSSGQMWTSDGGNIWNRQPWDDQRAPDGEGAGSPMTGYWGSAEHDVLNYAIDLTGAAFAKSGLPAKIDQAPADLTVVEGQAAAFAVTASGSQPLSFQWQASTDAGASFGAIAGETNATYAIPVAHPSADNQKKIRVVVSNAIGSENSAAATLTVTPDKGAPTVVFAGTLGNPSALVVEFSEGVNPAAAATLANYSLPGVVLTKASLVAPNKVLLEAGASISPGTLTVRDVVDQADARNVLSPNPTTMALDTQVHGVTMSIYAGLPNDNPGTLLDLTGSAAFPNSPSSVQYLATLETPANIADNYGAWLRGYLVPPSSGDYTFYLASDDAGEFYLDPVAGDSNSGNLVLMSSCYSAVGSRDWLNANVTASPATTLAAGQRYYFEAMLKEIAGLDYLAVTWVKSGAAVQALQAPIDGRYLLPFGSVAGGSPVVLKEPAAATVVAGSNLTLSASVAGSPPLAYQWYKDGAAVVGATQPVLSFTAVHSSSGTYRLGISNIFGSVSSGNALVNVQNQPGMWVEEGDAGDTLTNAQTTVGSGSLTQISGTIPDGWDHDLYKISVTNFSKFSATVTAPDGGDSRLALFDASGKGVVYNDDNANGNTALSAIDYAGSQLPSSNGVYYLGIMSNVEMPASTVDGTNAYIWTIDNPTSQKRPDGPGAAGAMVGFGGYGGSLANYSIALTGAGFGASGAVPHINLAIRGHGASLVLAWPAGSDADGFALQETAQLSASATWQSVTTTPVVANGENTVTLAPSSGAKFYRLIHP